MTAVQRLQHVSVPMPSDGHARARRFYSETLGLTPIEPPSTLDRNSVAWFRIGETDTEVHVFVDEPFRGGSPSQHLCLQVADLTAFRARLAANDVEIEETIPIHNRPRCFIHDPFGNRIEITEIRGPYA